MFKDLIESTFFIIFPPKENARICLNEKTNSGDFSLADDKACSQCHICENDSVNKVNLLIKSSTEVYSLKLDEVFEQIKEYMGENCDFILGDNNKVVLVEMTCSTSENVDCPYNGKRTKARSQFKNTLEKLYTDPFIKEFIDMKTGKHVIFSWKSICITRENDLVEKRFLDFFRLSDEMHSNYDIQKFDFGFDYLEIRYPTVLLWDEL